MSEADAELVERSLAGDRQAFAALVEAHLARMRAIALAVLAGDDAAADDATQEAFLRAWARLDQLGEPAGFAAWLAQIVRRQAIDQLRRRGRERLRPLPPDDLPAAETDDADRRQEQVQAALARLRPEWREILALRYQADLGYEAIADTLGLSVANVEKRLYRARQALLARLAATTGIRDPAAGDSATGHR